MCCVYEAEWKISYPLVVGPVEHYYYRGIHNNATYTVANSHMVERVAGVVAGKLWPLRSPFTTLTVMHYAN